MSIIGSAKPPREDKLEAIRKHAVRPEDIEPCTGCGLRLEPQIKGYDGKWRCVRCNELHADAVFREAGQSVPNPGEVPIILGVKRGQTGHDARAENGRGRPGPSSGEADGKLARRAKILKKYGINT